MWQAVQLGVEPSDVSDLSDFCNELFASLGRSDQRRWAEVYVRGLLTVPGRKSIRRISEQVVGRDADQSLQQFVNQSPWDWNQVRRSLAEQVAQAMRPRAWVVREVVFPKNGGSSVGVARQYAPVAGRMLNCQRAIGVFLAGDHGSTPVNWRLVLPKAWDDDAERRVRSRLPEQERSKPTWQYLLDLFDETIGDWGMPAAPVVVDLSSDPGAFPLLGGLEERRLPYLAQVSAAMPALPVNIVGSAGGGRTIGELVAAAAKRGRTKLSWRDEKTGELVGSDFVVTAMPGHTGPVAGPHGRGLPRVRHVLAEWPVGHARPRSVWLTNLGATGVREMVGLLRARAQVEVDVNRLTEEVGLRHFEGRSFQGWHHHVTLVSAAHGFHVMRELERQGFTEERLRPYA
ncbi:IS701 family transposase [Saccharothrix texasensis]|uniref:SRSO17 transposase n=1 Tax=Saccharothrix texasensis TaxID=103734 RepID=A0A3N1GY40_9PSEU|nr:IS701 family transposase [Saccharothrix texasensis]ROP35200.1 SRSO17 transposase [Saccharothrix texasensis]